MAEIKRTGSTLVISGELKIQFLEELKHELEELVRAEGQVRIDLGGVSELDMAGLQLLAAFVRSRAERGPVVLGPVSDAFRHAVRLSGLEEIFGPYWQ